MSDVGVNGGKGMKKSKYLTATVLSAAAMLIFGSVTAFAAVHFIKDALWHKQLNSNWCWAAVTETMVEKETSNFTAGGYSSRQARIVALAKGTTSNVTGNTDDMIRAMKQLNSSAFKNATWDYISTSSDFNDIEQEILSDDVVGINLYNAKPPFVSGQVLKGHSTYAYWVDSANDNILLADPWKSSNYIDVYKNALMNTGFECHAFPGIKVYGGIYLKY